MLLWEINEHTDEVISATTDDDIYPYFNNAVTWATSDKPCTKYPTKYDTNEHGFGRDCTISSFDYHEGTLNWAGSTYEVNTALHGFGSGSFVNPDIEIVKGEDYTN